MGDGAGPPVEPHAGPSTKDDPTPPVQHFTPPGPKTSEGWDAEGTEEKGTVPEPSPEGLPQPSYPVTPEEPGRAFSEEAFPNWVPWRRPRIPIETTQTRRFRVLAPIAIFIVAFAVYQFNVGQPSIIVFDETHYLKPARALVASDFLDESWHDSRPYNWEHPPFAKYLIAAGIWLTGNPHPELDYDGYAELCGQAESKCAKDARGWRLASTIAGASGIVAVYFLATRLFNRPSAGFFAAGLLLFDGLYYMHARLAMLDIFPTAFALWAFAHVLSPWERGRTLSAIFFGLGVASKLYVVFLLPVFVLCHFLRTSPPKWHDKADGLPPAVTPLRARLSGAAGLLGPWARRLLPALGLGLILPLFVFVLSYMPYLMVWAGMEGPIFAIRQVGFVLWAALQWDFGSNATHAYASSPATWPLMVRPVYYYTFDHPGGDVSRMWSLGNPIAWWAASFALILTTARIVLRFGRDYGWHYLRADALGRLVYHPFWMRRDLAFFLAALLCLFAYLPWFALQRITFLFYMTFVVPMLALLLGGLVAEQWDRGGKRRAWAAGFGALVVATFLLFYPVVSALRVDRAYYDFVMRLLPLLDVPHH